MTALTTTGTAARLLGRTEHQVVKLVETGVLPVLGRHGRMRLLDPVVVRALADRRPLEQVAASSGRAGTEPYALIVGLGPKVPDPNPALNLRPEVGWDDQHQPADSAWTGWWKTGETVADLCAALRLPLLGAVSGFVVAVRTIVGWTPHRSEAGKVRFEVQPAAPDVLARFRHTKYRPPPGPLWEILRRPVAVRALAQATSTSETGGAS